MLILSILYFFNSAQNPEKEISGPPTAPYTLHVYFSYEKFHRPFEHSGLGGGVVGLDVPRIYLLCGSLLYIVCMYATGRTTTRAESDGAHVTANKDQLDLTCLRVLIPWEQQGKQFTTWR